MVKVYPIGFMLDNKSYETKYTVFSDGAGTLEFVEDIPQDYVGNYLTLSIPTSLPVDSVLPLIIQAGFHFSDRNLEVRDTALLVSYLPYARADRKFSDGCVNARAVFERTALMFFDNIVCDDVHSRSSCINNNYDAFVTDYIRHLWPSLHTKIKKGVVFCAPDKGAVERVKINAEASKSEYVVCDKVRNIDNGWITGYTLNDPNKVKSKVVVIIDDICDGGKTFELCAKALKEAGATKVALYVTHGIFSKGLSSLEGIVDYIAVKNIIRDYITMSDIQEFNSRGGF